jgi:hypothetical protein
MDSRSVLAHLILSVQCPEHIITYEKSAVDIKSVFQFTTELLLETFSALINIYQL